MKFQKLSAFEKHFKEALSHHLSAIYVVVSPQESERKKILTSLSNLLKSRSDFAKPAQIGEALQHLKSGSLFSGKMTAQFDGVDQLLKGEMELLTSYVRSPNGEGCLLLGASKIKEVNALYKEGKSEMVILDLSKEKPWEERERMTTWAGQYLAFEKKRIHSDALNDLMNRLPPDRICIQKELDKLLCFVGDRTEIDLRDVRAICSEVIEVNPYQLARSLIWEKGELKTPLSDMAVLLQLTAALRSQLEMGLKMTALLKRGASSAEIEGAFPRLYPKNLRQCLDGARQKGEGFFLNGLKSLFDFEWGLKSSGGRPDVLLALFLGKLTYL